MNGEFIKEKYHLLKNPFPPAASGLEVETTRELFIPEKWKKEIDRYYRELQGGKGAKAFPIVGEYGSGKTVLLKNYRSFPNFIAKNIFYSLITSKLCLKFLSVKLFHPNNGKSGII